MVTKIIILVFQIFLASCELNPVRAETLIKSGYYFPREKMIPVSDIRSSLFTHLTYCCADLNSTSYQLSFSAFDESYVSNFTETVRKKNPSVITLLSIRGSDYSIRSSMASNSSYRKSFIDSSITTARHYGFGGLDFVWSDPKSGSNMTDWIIFFKEWRGAVNLESRNSSNHSQLILTAVLRGSPNDYSPNLYGIDMLQQYLNWSNVAAAEYSTPLTTYFTTAPSPLYNPISIMKNIDSSIRGWIDAGLSTNKIVCFLPYYGYAWKLVNATENGINSPAMGPANISENGFLEYDQIKNYVERFNANVIYNSTYVMNYCAVGTTWIGFDDVETIQAKVSYIKEKGLRGYGAWQISYDENWVLSQAAADAAISHPQQGATISPAQEHNGSEQNKRPHRLLAIILPATAAVMLLLGLVIYVKWMRKVKSKASADSVKETRSKANKAAAAGDFNCNAPNLVLYSLAEVEAATDKFSIEKKLGYITRWTKSGNKKTFTNICTRI